MKCLECGEEISEDDWAVNWGGCGECLDKHYKEYELEEQLRLITNQLVTAECELKKLKESAPPGEVGKSLAVALTYLQTSMLWLGIETREDWLGQKD